MGLKAVENYILFLLTFSSIHVVIVHKNIVNKKVLLRERKRHNARRVTSIPFAVLSGRGVPQSCPGDTHHWLGYPRMGVGGTPSLTVRYPILVHPLGKDLGPETWERTWDYGNPPPHVDGQTPVKTLPTHIPLEMRAVLKFSSSKQ